MNNQNIEDNEYTEQEITNLFFEACKRGKLKFIDFYIHSKELANNVNLSKNGYSGLSVALDNKQAEVINYLLQYKEVTSDSEFNFDNIFKIACCEDCPKVLEALINYSHQVGIATRYDFKEAFSCSCKSASVENINFFLSHQHLVGELSNEYILEKFDEAAKTANEKLVDFFLNNDSLDFKINSKYYFFKLSGFNPHYMRVKIHKGVRPLVESYELYNDLPISAPKNKIMKI